MTGRAPDVHLNARGKIEAERLADNLAQRPIHAIYTGPLERAWETAWPLSNRLMLERFLAPAFDEVDFGAWTSLTFADLEQRPDWRAWNQSRRVTPPHGESIQAVQDRVATELLFLSETHPGKTVAIISHGEVIKSAVMHFLGVPVEFHLRLEISPASVSILTICKGEPEIKALNNTGHLWMPALCAARAPRTIGINHQAASWPQRGLEEAVSF